MKAVWYEKEEISQPVLHVGEMPDVQAGCSRVRVKLHASGVVHGDTYPPTDWGTGTEEPWTKWISGQDGAGIIDQVTER